MPVRVEIHTHVMFVLYANSALELESVEVYGGLNAFFAFDGSKIKATRCRCDPFLIKCIMWYDIDMRAYMHTYVYTCIHTHANETLCQDHECACSTLVYQSVRM